MGIGFPEETVTKKLYRFFGGSRGARGSVSHFSMKVDIWNFVFKKIRDKNINFRQSWSFLKMETSPKNEGSYFSLLSSLVNWIIQLTKELNREK